MSNSEEVLDRFYGYESYKKYVKKKVYDKFLEKIPNINKDMIDRLNEDKIKKIGKPLYYAKKSTLYKLILFIIGIPLYLFIMWYIFYIVFELEMNLLFLFLIPFVAYIGMFFMGLEFYIFIKPINICNIITFDDYLCIEFLLGKKGIFIYAQGTGITISRVIPIHKIKDSHFWKFFNKKEKKMILELENEYSFENKV